MTLLNMLNLWEIVHPDEGFFDDIYLNEKLDKDDLLGYILLECGNMEPVDDSCTMFQFRIKNFFKVHSYNIDKLVDSLYFDYDPMSNFAWEEERKMKKVHFKSALNKKYGIESQKIHDNKTLNDDSETTAIGTEHSEGTSHNDEEYGSLEKGEVHKNSSTSTNGNSDTDENMTHYVSAYNNQTFPDDDVEDYRTSSSKNVTDSTSGTGNEDTTTRQENGGTTVNDGKTNSDSNKSDNTVFSDTTSESYDSDKTVNGREQHTYNEGDDDKLKEVTKRKGINDVTYQSLIESERRLAQFNIYKWILDHWCREMMIGVM